MIADFITWWSSQLASLIPRRLQRQAGAQTDAIIIETPATTDDPGDLLIRLRRNQRENRLGAVRSDAAGLASLRAMIPARAPARMVLRVPAALLLERTIVLPAAAGRDWLNVVRFEMIRLTPFAPQDIFWTGAIIQRDPARGKLTVLLSIVPAAALRPLIERLRHNGVNLAAIEVNASDGGVRTLIPEASTNDARQGPGLRLLGGLCAAMIIAAIALPFIIQSRRESAVDHRIARLRPIAAHVELLRRRILAGTASLNVTAQARAEAPDPLVILAAVTQALPDDTYLTRLTLRHLKLSLAGRSAAAPKLIAALSAEPMLKHVTFSAPVTRDRLGHRDVFAIRAVVATMPQQR